MYVVGNPDTQMSKDTYFWFFIIRPKLFRDFNSRKIKSRNRDVADSPEIWRFPGSSWLRTLLAWDGGICTVFPHVSFRSSHSQLIPPPLHHAIHLQTIFTTLPSTTYIVCTSCFYLKFWKIGKGICCKQSCRERMKNLHSASIAHGKGSLFNSN